MIPLGEIYRQYVNKFNRTGEHPHPSELLALLLLQDKDNYDVAAVPIDKDFIEYYREQINEKIEQVTVDFWITKEEILSYLGVDSNTRIDDADYEHLKFVEVFRDGVEVLERALSYYKDSSPEICFNKDLGIYGMKLGEESVPIYHIGRKYSRTRTRKKCREIRRKKTERLLGKF